MSASAAAAILGLLFFGCFSSAGAQVPIPARIDGFVYWRGAPLVWGGSVVVEAFLDPMCPDSRGSWPPLRKALRHYNGTVNLVVHPFALPYHSNSFVACRALHIANGVKESAVYPLLEQFFDHQDRFYNVPTYKQTRAAVVAQMAVLARPVIGGDHFEAFFNGFKDNRTDEAARISFKYGCSRGVIGAPYFFVNGMPLPVADLPPDFDKWKSIFDPLVYPKAR